MITLRTDGTTMPGRGTDLKKEELNDPKAGITTQARTTKDILRRLRSPGRRRSGSRDRRCNRVKTTQPSLFGEEADIFGDIRLSPPKTYSRSTRSH